MTFIRYIYAAYNRIGLQKFLTFLFEQNPLPRIRFKLFSLSFQSFGYTFEILREKQ